MAPIRAQDPIVHSRHHKGRNPKTGKTAARRLLSGSIASLVAVGITCYSLGYFPGIDEFFSGIHRNLQSHNDQIVAGIVSAAPYALIAAALGGLLMMVSSSVNGARRRRERKLAS